MEFNQREKLIVMATSFLSNEMVQKVPAGTISLGLKVMLESQGIRFELAEVEDVIDAIKAEQKLSVQQGFAFLDKHKDALK